MTLVDVRVRYISSELPLYYVVDGYEYIQTVSLYEIKDVFSDSTYQTYRIHVITRRSTTDYSNFSREYKYADGSPLPEDLFERIPKDQNGLPQSDFIPKIPMQNPIDIRITKNTNERNETKLLIPPINQAFPYQDEPPNRISNLLARQPSFMHNDLSSQGIQNLLDHPVNESSMKLDLSDLTPVKITQQTYDKTVYYPNMVNGGVIQDKNTIQATKKEYPTNVQTTSLKGKVEPFVPMPNGLPHSFKRIKLECPPPQFLGWTPYGVEIYGPMNLSHPYEGYFHQQPVSLPHDPPVNRKFTFFDDPTPYRVRPKRRGPRIDWTDSSDDENEPVPYTFGDTTRYQSIDSMGKLQRWRKLAARRDLEEPPHLEFIEFHLEHNGAFGRYTFESLVDDFDNVFKPTHDEIIYWTNVDTNDFYRSNFKKLIMRSGIRVVHTAQWIKIFDSVPVYCALAVFFKKVIGFTDNIPRPPNNELNYALLYLESHLDEIIEFLKDNDVYLGIGMKKYKLKV